VKEAVVVAMSGGVDSSVAAHLLKEAGHPVIGMTLKTWPKELCDTVPKNQTCCSTRDIEDARAVAHQLGIPFYVVEAAELFKQEVMERFVQGYARGLTPNPCVVCNRKIKCGVLLAKARALGARWLATGHYARVGWNESAGRFGLWQAKDAQKDQSYVLFQLAQDQLANLLLPLGEKTKGEIREIAQRIGLRVADKPESMELCFIPDGDTQGFLKSRAPEGFQPGPIVNRKGSVLGTHQGIAAYTTGQRKGLGVAHPRPRYGLEIKTAANPVVVGVEEELAADSCLVEELHWVSVPGLAAPRQAQVKARYRGDRAWARLTPAGDNVQVDFLEPLAGGVSPGQAAVFYEGDLVLGGGWIAR
jgi:tRNA-specific 2-thiouridylase